MPYTTNTVVYQGSFGGVNAVKGGHIATLTAPNGIPVDAELLSIRCTIGMTANHYTTNSKYHWELHHLAIGDPNGTPYTRWQSTTDSENSPLILGNITGPTELKFTMSGLGNNAVKFQNNTVQLAAQIYCNYSTVSHMNDVSLEVTYRVLNIKCIGDLRINGELSTSKIPACLTWTALPTGNTVSDWRYEIEVTPSLPGFDKHWAWLNVQPVAGIYTIPDVSVIILNYYPEEALKGTFTINIRATSTSTGQSVTLMSEPTVQFQYLPVRPLSYYTDNGWVKCHAYYHNGTEWVLVDPYYHDGTKWVPCSTN